jgi:hypothetical protein
MPDTQVVVALCTGATGLSSQSPLDTNWYPKSHTDKLLKSSRKMRDAAAGLLAQRPGSNRYTVMKHVIGAGLGFQLRSRWNLADHTTIAR